MSTQRKLLVTSALAYANGSLHLGHLVEHIQTDIWVRFQQAQGHDCLAVCGVDAHGTPIMIKAEQLGVNPAELTEQYRQQHLHDFNDFHIHYACYHTTHSAENEALTQTIYTRLQANGDITRDQIRQAFDPKKNMFLPDRFVKGECPVCHQADQYGDSCEHCGATYSPLELINPRSSLTGATPITRESEHLFFNLPKYGDFLQQWHQTGHVQSEVANKLNEWFTAGLRRWDISRDAPYFGFEIPDETDKYFYVWLDAPIGYMASFQKFCQTHPHYDFMDYWGPDSDVQLYHFVGKDIMYFHALFWPAVLHAAGFRTPTAIFTHGFLTINGEKMSKSRGTFIQARTYLNHLHPEYLRYYYATKLTNSVEDLDLNFEDFSQRVNADLVGKVINIASRCSGFIHKHFDGQLSSHCHQPDLYQHFVDAGQSIAQCYEDRQYRQAMRHIMQLADRANQYIDQYKPWQLIKQTSHTEQVQQICSLGLNLFRVLMIYLQPILPHTAEQVATFLNCPALTWEQRHHPLLAHHIQPFTPLLQRIDPAQISAMLDEAQSTSETE
ncbi:MAG: methionine--tRNA ligase [Legionellales bacterium]|nr:methionine--tRNA ligase [Legionellales bacterium]